MKLEIKFTRIINSTFVFGVVDVVHPLGGMLNILVLIISPDKMRKYSASERINKILLGYGNAPREPFSYIGELGKKYNLAYKEMQEKYCHDLKMFKAAEKKLNLEFMKLGGF